MRAEKSLAICLLPVSVAIGSNNTPEVFPQKKEFVDSVVYLHSYLYIRAKAIDECALQVFHLSALLILLIISTILYALYIHTRHFCL